MGEAPTPGPGRWLAPSALVAGLAATALAGRWAWLDVEAAARREVEFAASEVQARIEDRVKDHEQVLWAGAGLLDAAGPVSRAQWRAWVERSDVQRRLPGIEATTWVSFLRSAELPAHVEATRREGFAGYRVWPPSGGDEHAVVTFLEPFTERNRRAFGFDELSEPVRREAMERARDRGVAALSGPIRLVQEAGPEAQPGALMVVPVYRPGAPAGTPEARRAALAGWVVAAYRLGDLMSGILGGREADADRPVLLALYDGAPAPATLLYEGPAAGADGPGAIQVDRAITTCGRRWTLRFAAPGPAGPGGRVLGVLLSGGVISLLLFALTASLRDTRRRARALAGRLTAELEASQQRLELAIEGGDQGLWDWDARTGRLTFNERATAMLGHAPGGLDGPRAAYEALVHPDDLPGLVAARERHSRGEAPGFESEHRVRHRDGRWIWVAVRGRVARRAAGGEPLEAGGTIGDVTARRLAAEALRESEARFQRTADTAPVMIWTCGVDAKCDWFNRGWLDFTGRPMEAQLGDGWAAGVHPEDLDGCLAGFLGAFRERRPFTLEYRLRRHDGAYRWIVDNGVPRHDGAGAFAGYIGACADVTDERQAREALERSLEALRIVEAAVAQAPVSIVITDRAGVIEYVNPAFERITGYARAEAIGRHTRLTKSGHHDDEFYAELWGTLVAGRVWQGQIVNRTRSGGLITEQVIIAPVRDGRGEIQNFVAVKRDVSLERSLERQLAQAQRLESVGRLAGGVAHDFNNLLTVVLGCCGSLLADLSEGRPAAREDVEEIRAAGHRARDLTRQLLAFARRQVIDPVPIDLNEVVRGCESLLRRTLGEDVELAVSLQPGLWSTRGDRGQLEQVVLNLAINARDAMSGGGRLTLQTVNVVADAGRAALFPGLAPGRYVGLVVQDSGAGIPAEIRDRIFEPFFTTKEVGRGTGLGLATVYGIVQQSGGAIRVESEVGYGTAFELLLPCTPEAAADPAAVDDRPAAGGSERVLLVEDDAAVRGIVARELRGAGYEVLEAASGAEALSLAREAGPPALLVTDVVMPDLDGRTLAETLRAGGAGPPALFISGYPQDVLGRHGVLDPGVEFLPKPFTAQDLLRRVRAILDRPAGG